MISASHATRNFCIHINENGYNKREATLFGDNLLFAEDGLCTVLRSICEAKMSSTSSYSLVVGFCQTYFSQ